MHSRTSILLTLLATVRGLVPPFISTVVLVAVAGVLDVRFTGHYVALGLVAALLVWIAIGKDEHTRTTMSSSVLVGAGRTIIEWCAVVATLLLIGYATKTSANFSRLALFAWFTITPALLITVLALIDSWMRSIAMSRRNARRTAIVGENHLSTQLAEVIKRKPELGLRLERMIDVNDIFPREPRQGKRSAELRAMAVCNYVKRDRIDSVFVALPVETDETRAILDALRDTTSSVYLLPDLALHELIQARSDEIEGIPVIALCESPLQGTRGLTKRVTDVVLALLLLVCTLPAMLLIAAAIKLTSPGKVIFKQNRYGLDGERIVVFKFRTMTVMQNGPDVVQATRNDPRVTPVGRFLRRTSLDELPQLFNVLLGSMSLVGPRPHAVAHVEQYRKLVSGYMVRHKVVPGMTGLAQINGCRGEISSVEDIKRRVQYDLEYMRHWCWLLDLKILAKTVAVLFGDKHAY